MTESTEFKVRLPKRLHAKIVAKARANNRSMNSEIVHRLDDTMRADVIRVAIREELAGVR